MGCLFHSMEEEPMKMIHKVSLAVCVSTWRARWLWSHHLSLATLAHFGKEYDDGM